MSRNKSKKNIVKSIVTGGFCLIASVIYAGKPLFILTPLTATTVTVPSNGTAEIQYTVINNSKITRTLTMQPIRAITQSTGGAGVCANPFTLAPNQSCVLTLVVDGQVLSSASDSGIDEGPIVCKITDNGKNTPDPFLCAQPAVGNRLNITLGTFLGEATLAVTGSPLILVANGAVGQLVIQNTSTDITATNISADFTGTALDGNVTETGNTCAQLVPGGICTLTFTPGATVVPQTNFPIFGDNTGTITAAIQVSSGISLTSVTPNSGSSLGQTGVTLRGTVLNGVTGVTFGGTAATNVTVVNSTTVTAVTPLHDAGAVDVTVTTGAETSTLVNGYTYNAIALGQSTGGGVIACLNTGNLLIVTNDNLPSGPDGFGGGNRWGGNNINVTGTNNTAGATNTQIIVNCLTNGIGAGCTGGIPSANYAAGICSNYEIDSQGHSPCQAGNACYNDWFLPAGFNTTDSGQLNCIWTNRASIPNLPTNNFYWSSTQATASDARSQSMANGTEATDSKLNQLFVRCVRSFTTP